MNDGCGRFRLKTSSSSPLTVTLSRLVYQDARGFLRNSSGSFPVSVFQVHCTSFAENGLPSCHLTPWRSVKMSLVLSPFQDQLSARSGTMLLSLFCFSFGSNITRLLNTPIIGIEVEMVASSWIDMLGGLSRCRTCRMPPCFSANAGVANVPAASRTAVGIVAKRE